jgi:hypothetical protein
VVFSTTTRPGILGIIDNCAYSSMTGSVFDTVEVDAAPLCKSGQEAEKCPKLSK